MGFPWEWGLVTNWEWEWEGMGNNLYGNGNGHYSHGNQFPSADTALSLCNSTVYCKLSTQAKIKTYNILNYYISGFCTIKMHT